MKEIIALKFVLCCIEETIKSILMVKKDFDVDLFRQVLKKNIYEILSDDDYTIGVEEVMKKASISYDLANDHDEDENEDAENFEISIDIPLGSIITAVNNMIGRGEVDDVYNERDLKRDLNLIDQIWEEWTPIDDFGVESKGMVIFLLDNLELN